MRLRYKRWISLLLAVVMMLTLGACGVQSQSDTTDKIAFDSLEKTGQMTLAYATQYQVEYYGDYSLITIGEDQRFLLVPEGKDLPKNLPEDVVALQQPLDKTYLVSTSVMDLIRQLDRISYIRLSGSKAKDWYITEAKEAIEAGNMIYAGKYSAPDYECILNEGCNLAIENTMIYHTPEVKEKLEELGIPVLVERSSYETHPLGRLEWIKLYGLLFDALDEANAYFDSQVEQIMPLLDQANTGKTVAFFSVNSSGAINVRKPGDYITQMITMAGGNYALADVVPEEENALSTMNMQMEDFYNAAQSADILIYNSAIEGEITSIDELLAKNSLFAQFDAVKKGNVYCTGKNFFQESTGMAEFVEDMHNVLGDADADLTYLKKLN
ncbi:MAG: ABC transporter substrate-binding protein [Roseburia lenta]|nr:ABC transporter substrate-binding protein [Roseburia lenta]